MQYSNEELVAIIQAGESSLLPFLWSQVQAFVRQQAARCLRAWRTSRPTLEFDDLYQCGYIALCEAVETYQAGKNGSFLGWLSFYLKTEFSSEIGCRTEKQRQDPLSRAVSLDAPIGGETEDITLGDTVADPKDQYEDAERAVYLQQLQSVVAAAMEDLPEGERVALRMRYFDDLTLKEAGGRIGVTPQVVQQRERRGIRRLRQQKYGPALREAWYGDRNLYRNTNFSSWQRTGFSVEEITLIRKEADARAEVRAERQRRRMEARALADEIAFYIDELGMDRADAERLARI